MDDDNYFCFTKKGSNSLDDDDHFRITRKGIDSLNNDVYFCSTTKGIIALIHWMMKIIFALQKKVSLIH